MVALPLAIQLPKRILAHRGPRISYFLIHLSWPNFFEFFGKAEHLCGAVLFVRRKLPAILMAGSFFRRSAAV